MPTIEVPAENLTAGTATGFRSNPAGALGNATTFGPLSEEASIIGERPVIVERRLLPGGALTPEAYRLELASKLIGTLAKRTTADLVGQR